VFHSDDDERMPQSLKALPQVTLVAIDGTLSPAATEESLARASALMAFRKVVLCSPVRSNARAELWDGYDWVKIPPKTLKGYNQFCLTELRHHVQTTHCLTVQSDSRIVNPAAWDDRWLEYDYIGAPWPPGHSGTDYRVGNSGFCLRSRKLLEATSTLPNETYVWRGKVKHSCRDDVITCVMYRDHLESLGLQFAPVDVAARFSFESSTPEAPVLSDQFGTHALRRKRSTEHRKTR
jgi:hypothetical protein